jgi:transglutaminase-like putative cysteine protease
MMLTIRHETLYSYTEPAGYSIQNLRLTPRSDAHQRTLSWTISSPGRTYPFVDAFGNHSHMLTITAPHHETRIVVEGEVEVAKLDRGRLADKAEQSPMLFTVPTRLTEPDQAIIEFARAVLPTRPASKDFLLLAEQINAAVAYETGATHVATTAADALRLARGVCQDHAHLFLACCHATNTPARYVSGYIDTGSTDAAESHAWADVWVEEQEFAGWISIDVTHAAFQGSHLCRLAVGRDYDSAGPVRGVRRGGGVESLWVEVNVMSHSQ